MGNKTIRLSSDVVSRRVGDEVVLVHVNRNQMYTLNRTGARAWELLGEGLDLPAVEAALVSEFDTDGADVRRELEALVAALEESGLVDQE